MSYCFTFVRMSSQTSNVNYEEDDEYYYYIPFLLFSPLRIRRGRGGAVPVSLSLLPIPNPLSMSVNTFSFLFISIESSWTRLLIQFQEGHNRINHHFHSHPAIVCHSMFGSCAVGWFSSGVDDIRILGFIPLQVLFCSICRILCRHKHRLF